MINLTPKQRRNISRIVPFAIIWWVVGWVFIILELGITRNQNLNPDTDIAYTIPVLALANVANIIVGLIVGTIEMVYLERRFRNQSLKSKLFYKTLVYLFLFVLILVVFYPIAFSLETKVGFFDGEGWEKFLRFFTSISFLVTVFQLTVTLFISLSYAAVSENLGHQVFLNFFSGKYHKPIVENRIFMFLDMKSSTSIAEALGHVKYFQLLQDYYDLMSDAIIDNYGEVYQYIGDEIVVSWELEKGLKKAHCISCFFDIQKKLNSKQKELINAYGYEIDFKAGVHFGEVTIGEIGALKKEIVFTGDVLNTTARIQSLCNQYDSKLLISGALKNELNNSKYKFSFIGEIQLKGRREKEVLFIVNNVL